MPATGMPARMRLVRRVAPAYATGAPESARVPVALAAACGPRPAVVSLALVSALEGSVGRRVSRRDLRVLRWLGTLAHPVEDANGRLLAGAILAYDCPVLFPECEA